MDYTKYQSIQLETASSPLIEAIDTAEKIIAEEKKSKPSAPMYNTDQISEIISECNSLTAFIPESSAYWTAEVRSKFTYFLKNLKEGAYQTPEECYKKGKSRGYLSHLKWFTSHIKDPQAVLIDLAGRSGYANTIFKYMGFPNSCTLEFSPINIISGRYIWGHKNIYHGDAQYLKKAECPFADLSQAASIDGVFCRYALEHFLDLDKFFADLSFLLKPGGIAGFIVGQSMKSAITTGDFHFFPDAASIYGKAPELVMVDYKFQKIIAGKVWEHLILLKKPDDPSMFTPASLRKRPLTKLKNIIRKFTNFFRK